MYSTVINRTRTSVFVARVVDRHLRGVQETANTGWEQSAKAVSTDLLTLKHFDTNKTIAMHYKTALNKISQKSNGIAKRVVDYGLAV